MKSKARFSLILISLLCLALLPVFLFLLGNPQANRSLKSKTDNGTLTQDKRASEKRHSALNLPLGIPLSSSQQRKHKEGLLALKVVDEGGGAAQEEPVHFLHLESLRLGKGFTDSKGEFRVFQEGIYLFLVGGARCVRNLLPPTRIQKQSRGIQGVKTRRIRLALGGKLKVLLRTIPKGTPFVHSRGILVFSPKKQMGIHWRRRRDLFSQSFLEFVQARLRSQQKIGMPLKKAAVSFDQNRFQRWLSSYKKWVGVQEEAWIPYVDPSFLLVSPDKNGILVWNGLPHVSLRWGLEDTEISLRPDPPFRDKEYRVKEEKTGQKTFVFLGRKPRDLSGSFRIPPGQERVFHPHIFSGNGVVVSVPMPKGWFFQTKPILVSLNRKGDPRHGGSIDAWVPERKGKFSEGRFLFPDLETGKTKEVYCWIRNPGKTEYALLKSSPFVFEGGWKDLGALIPMKGEDSRLQIVVDGDPQKAKAIFPLTFGISVDGYHLKEISMAQGKELVFKAGRGKTLFLHHRPSPLKANNLGDSLFFHSWKFVEKGKRDISFHPSGGFGHVAKMRPLHRIHIAPFKHRNILIRARIVGPEGILPQDLLLILHVRVFPSGAEGGMGDIPSVHPQSKVKAKMRKKFEGFISMDADVHLRAISGKVTVATVDKKGRRKRRDYSGFTTQVTPPISIDLKPQVMVQFQGLEKHEKDLADFFLQPKALFEKGVSPWWGTGTIIEKKKGGFRTKFPIPAPEVYVLLRVHPQMKRPRVLGTFKILSTTSMIQVP